MGLSITKDQIAELPLETFNGEIIIIDKADQVQDAVNRLLMFNTLGFDTETKPAFKRGQTNKVALMQISTEDECYLFRLNKIGYPDLMDDIICNQDIKKIGLSLRDDFAAIRGRSKNIPMNFVDLQLFVDKFDIEDNSLQKIYALLFGKRISKGQRLSNWESSVFTPAQQSYAAIDAWACLRIYNYLTQLELS